MISVIVPVYNAEKYLRETVQSVLNQDFKDIEIILINDGSTDSSLEICKDFERKYSQIKVIDQENSGVSVARNRGLEEAAGDYIAFADADDIMKADMLSTLYRCAVEHDAQMVSCGAGLVENDKIIKEEYGTNTLKEYDKEQALKFFLIGKQVNIGVWTKLFKKELICDIRFLENKKINEDKLFIFEALMKTDRFVVNDVTKYLYYKREGSATTRAFDARWFDSLDIADYIYDEIMEKKPELAYYAEINRVKSYYWLLLKLYRTEGCVSQYAWQYQRIVRYLKKTPCLKMRQYLTSNMFLQISLLKVSEPLLRKMKQKGK